MSRSSPSRSGRKSDDADVSYEIKMSFEKRNATIYLFAHDDETVEVLIGNIPVPAKYHNNYNSTDNDFHRQHGVARWIVDDAAQELDEWGYKTSSYKSNNPNYFLRDVYFKCENSEVNTAVLAAKRFLTTLEEKVVRQRETNDKEHSASPQQDLISATE